MSRLSWAFVAAIIFVSISFAAVPPPQGYVSDYINLFDSQSRAQIDQVLRAIESGTGAEIAVVTQGSLDDYASIEEMALDYLTQWKVGKKGKDNGLILLIVIDKENNFRQYRFETGLGLEGDLPDGRLGQIGREELVPYFKSGDYGQGALAAVISIGQILGADLNIEAPKRPKRQVQGIGAFIFLIIMLLFLLGGRGRGGGSGLLWALLLGSMVGHRGRGGFGGGFGGGGFGGGGGGFGGFGGGGGGAGGGASGSW